MMKITIKKLQYTFKGFLFLAFVASSVKGSDANKQDTANSKIEKVDVTAVMKKTNKKRSSSKLLSPNKKTSYQLPELKEDGIIMRYSEFQNGKYTGVVQTQTQTIKKQKKL